MIVLFWDIDGTLLTTARAGVFAWEDSLRELTGREVDFSSTRTAGLTDYQIAVKTYEMLGIAPTAEAPCVRYHAAGGGTSSLHRVRQSARGNLSNL